MKGLAGAGESLSLLGMSESNDSVVGRVCGVGERDGNRGAAMAIKEMSGAGEDAVIGAASGAGADVQNGSVSAGEGVGSGSDEAGLVETGFEWVGSAGEDGDLGMTDAGWRTARREGGRVANPMAGDGAEDAVGEFTDAVEVRGALDGAESGEAGESSVRTEAGSGSDFSATRGGGTTTGDGTSGKDA